MALICTRREAERRMLLWEKWDDFHTLAPDKLRRSSGTVRKLPEKIKYAPKISSSLLVDLYQKAVSSNYAQTCFGYLEGTEEWYKKPKEQVSMNEHAIKRDSPLTYLMPNLARHQCVCCRLVSSPTLRIRLPTRSDLS